MPNYTLFKVAFFKTITIPKMNSNALFSLLLLCLFLTACRESIPVPLYDIQKKITADSAMVVSAHPLASEIGKDILQEGGNAIDAAIAIQFALAVVYPRAGNIGGGGFMVIRNQNGSIDALDYREKAPFAANRDMYLDEEGNVIDSLSKYGHLAVGVPGTVAGMFAAHAKYGQIKDIKRLIKPAIKLAALGFAVTETEANRLNKFRDTIAKINIMPNPFIKTTAWKEGDKLTQPELAQTLQLIHDQGQAGFYKGSTADKFIAEMQRGNGIITKEDLAQYQAKWRAPVTGNYKDYKIISMPPPSSGGIALIQLLKIMENYPLSEYGFHTPAAVHLMAEAERRVYADRAEHLGDSDFYKVPIDSLLSTPYLKERMSSFDSQQVTPSDSILGGEFELGLESFETTHTSVIDPMGNAVSVTTTLNSNYGSKVMVSGAGFFLNNEMDDFSAKPGVPNQFGLVGAEANAIQPQKRMLSSMTPTIVEKDGKIFMVLGAPGGSTIITAVFQVFTNVAEFGMDLQTAVNAKRFHHQWLPDEILVEEEALSGNTREKLEAMGHQFREVKRMAVIKAIHVLPNGQLVGVGDPRNPDDDVAGF